jgi:cytochrome c-type biogenesis protein CcmE
VTHHGYPPGVAKKRSPARLVIALSIAAVLAVFLLYTSIAGGTPSVKPSELAGQAGAVSLVGRVVGRPTGDAHAGGLRFRLRDVKDTSGATVPVVYTGSVPDLFASGRDIVVDGTLKNGTFVAAPGTMVTKCPSKYTSGPPKYTATKPAAQ